MNSIRNDNNLHLWKEPHLSRRLPAEWREQVAAAASAPADSPSSARRYSGKTPRRSRRPDPWTCTRRSPSCFSSSSWHYRSPRRRRSTPSPLRTWGRRVSLRRRRRMLPPRRTHTPCSTGIRRGPVPPGSLLADGDTSICHTERDNRQHSGLISAHLSAKTQRLRIARRTKTLSRPKVNKVLIVKSVFFLRKEKKRKKVWSRFAGL